jgi:hypothetical protein
MELRLGHEVEPCNLGAATDTLVAPLDRTSAVEDRTAGAAQPPPDASDNRAMPHLRSLLAAIVLIGCLPDTQLIDEPRRQNAAPPEPAVPDDGPPRLGEIELTPAGDCIRLRVTSDRPAAATATFRAGEVVEEWALGAGATLFDLAIRPQRLPPAQMATATVSAQDPEGRRATSTPLPFEVPARGSPLAITELLINPAGPETSQEYVEIRNLGTQPFPLAGVRLHDDTGSDELPARDLAPAAVALVVATTFDPDSGADPSPAPDTPLLRVDGRLGRDGLRQDGEVVRLLGPGGELLSSYGGWVNASKPGWQGRSVQRVPDPAACDHPRSWSDSPQPPTPGW